MTPDDLPRSCAVCGAGMRPDGNDGEYLRCEGHLESHLFDVPRRRWIVGIAEVKGPFAFDPASEPPVPGPATYPHAWSWEPGDPDGPTDFAVCPYCDERIPTIDAEGEMHRLLRWENRNTPCPKNGPGVPQLGNR